MTATLVMLGIVTAMLPLGIALHLLWNFHGFLHLNFTLRALAIECANETLSSGTWVGDAKVAADAIQATNRGFAAWCRAEAEIHNNCIPRRLRKRYIKFSAS